MMNIHRLTPPAFLNHQNDHLNISYKIATQTYKTNLLVQDYEWCEQPPQGLCCRSLHRHGGPIPGHFPTPAMSHQYQPPHVYTITFLTTTFLPL